MAQEGTKMAVWRAKMAQEGAKMAIWSAKMAQEGAKMAIWRPFGSYLWHFSRSWERSLRRSPKYKIEHPYNVFGDFLGPGGSGWRLLEAILGDLGLKLGSLGRSCLPVGAILVDLSLLGLR